MKKTSRKTLRSPNHKILCQVLIDQRNHAGMTQAQVAETLSWPQSDISKIETGDRRLDVIEFVQLCDAIDIDPCAVIEKLL